MNGPYVFISYSSKETAAAEQTRSVLRKNGIACWMAPASIEGGSDYTKSIPAAISNCSAVVLICSANSQSSYWVKSEVLDAITKGKTVIPFIIDKAEMNDEFNFMLSPAQRILAYENRAKAYEKLVSSLKSMLTTQADRTADEKVEPETETEPEAPFNRMEEGIASLWAIYILLFLLCIIGITGIFGTAYEASVISLVSLASVTVLHIALLICLFAVKKCKKTFPDDIDTIYGRLAYAGAFFYCFPAALTAVGMISSQSFAEDPFLMDTLLGILLIASGVLCIVSIAYTVYFCITGKVLIKRITLKKKK